jgi:AcrR family transcriptional regulator
MIEPTTRERIIAAAVALFAEQGYDATSVNQVVQRAEVAKGALYHHFTAKDDLLFEVYNELIARQLDNMKTIVAKGLGPADTMRELIFDLVTTTAARAAEAKVFAREGHRLGDENQKRVRSARREYHDSVAGLIRKAQATGEFSEVASPEMVTFTVFGVINELPVWYQPHGRKRPAAIADELSDFVLAALEPRKVEPRKVEPRKVESRKVESKK